MSNEYIKRYFAAEFVSYFNKLQAEALDGHIPTRSELNQFLIDWIMMNPSAVKLTLGEIMDIEKMVQCEITVSMKLEPMEIA